MAFSPNLQFYMLLTLNAFLIGTKILMEICNECKKQLSTLASRKKITLHTSSLTRCNAKRKEKNHGTKRTRQYRMNNSTKYLKSWTTVLNVCDAFYWSIFTHCVFGFELSLSCEIYIAHTSIKKYIKRLFCFKKSLATVNSNAN